MSIMTDKQPNRHSRTIAHYALHLIPALAVCVLILNQPALGQAGSPPAKKPAPAGAPPTPKTHPNDPSIWDVDQMMDDAASQIARRYNLNTAQEQYTRLMLINRVRKFLDVHETDIRELLKESIAMRRLKGGNAQQYTKWATRAAPIYHAAMQAIRQGNEEWGSILDAEQKKIHETDLNQMSRSFDNVNRMLNNWKSGKTPLPKRIGSGNPPETINRVSDNPPVYVNLEDSWIKYVQKFIHAYGLGDEQKEAASAIHKEEHQRAKQWREAHRGDIQVNRVRLNRAENDVLKQRYEQKRFDLEERTFHVRFIKLEKRLDGLLTQKQRASISEDDKKVLERMADQNAGRNAKRPEIRATPPPKPAADTAATDASKTEKPSTDATAAPAKTAAPEKPAAPPKKKTDKAGPKKGDEKKTGSTDPKAKAKSGGGDP